MILRGTNIVAGEVASTFAPEGYRLIPPGFGMAPGDIRQGPDDMSTTSVCLLEGDDGDWFKKVVLERKGTVTEV